MTATPEPDRMSRHDAAFLEGSALHRPHVLALVLLAPGPGGETMTRQRLLDLLERRIHRMPRLRQVLHDVPSGTPVWVDDDAFSLVDHVHVEQRPPADRRELGDVVARLHQLPLSTGRPLWAAHVLDVGTDCAALAFRWHHAMVDGMSGVAIARVLFDREPYPVEATDHAPPAGSAIPPLRVRDETDDADDHRDDRAAEDRATELAEDVAFLDGWLELMAVERDGLPLGGDPSAPVRVAWTTVSMERLRAVCRRHHASVHRVVVSVVAGAMARFSAARGERREHLRALTPIARLAPDREQRLGNHASFALVPLPVGPLDEAARLRAVVAACDRARTDPQAAAVDRALQWLDTLPVRTQRLMTAVSERIEVADLIVSYMPGPVGPRWLAGTRHLATVPVLPVSGTTRVAVGAMRLGEVVAFGVTAGVDALPEIELFVQSLGATVTDLLDA